MRSLTAVLTLSLSTLAGCASTAPAPAPTPTATRHSPPWGGDAESAEKFLETTDSITTTAPVGDGPERSPQSRAFAKLYHSEKPGDRFFRLYGDATTAGKFWALLGLRFLKDDREAKLRDDFMTGERGTILYFPLGCRGSRVDAKRELPDWLERIDTGELAGLLVESS
jgi:hypothetical protein